MSNIYSKRLAGPVSIPSGGDLLLYTVPAGRVAVVKWIAVVNNSATATPVVRVAIGSALLGANRVLRSSTPPDTSKYELTHLALISGESLYATGEGTGSITLTVSGYEFGG